MKSRFERSRDATTQRETTPERPVSRPIARDGLRKDGTLPAAAGTPESNRASHGLGRNQEGTASEASDGAKTANHADPTDNWGFLPPQVRDVFRTQGGGDLPAQYREWIDAYYKRLNKQR
jgi:hypothetical protein